MGTVLGPRVVPATHERRTTVFNDSEIVSGAPPASYTNVTPKGKFFPRGMRGMIEEIQVYCNRRVAAPMTILYSPHPGLGPFGEIEVTAAVGWSWVSVAVEEMWDYDSLFLWTYIGSANLQFAYDEEKPYDGHQRGVDIDTWSDLDNRLFIRVVMAGETAGDVPISGIVNNIPIPNTSSQEIDSGHALPADTELSSIRAYGAGYCDYIEARVDAAVDSQLTYVRVYTDGVLAMEESFTDLFTYGHAPTTPTVSLSAFGEDDFCCMLIHKRFEFKWLFRFSWYNLPSPQTVSVDAHLTKMK